MKYLRSSDKCITMIVMVMYRQMLLFLGFNRLQPKIYSKLLKEKTFEIPLLDAKMYCSDNFLKEKI